MLAQFGPGDYFGEASIFETLRRTATVRATSPGTVLAMFGADFAVLVDHVPELRAAHRRRDRGAVAARVGRCRYGLPHASTSLRRTRGRR